MITHANFVALITTANNGFFFWNIFLILFRLPEVFPGDTYISYLPLPHILEHSAYWWGVYRGFKTGIYNGDVKKLKFDC
jgi:long-subunit acyl-CoA synthetase (AMP-forming)